MKMVEVHNLNVHPYSEMFRGQLIEIPAKSYIEMESEEAVMFLGTMNQVMRDADGNVRPESYKMLKKVSSPAEKKKLEDAKKKATELKCQACGYQATSKQDLHIHTVEEHGDQLSNAKVAKQLLKKA